MSYIILFFFIKSIPPIFLYLILIIFFHISISQFNQSSNAFSFSLSSLSVFPFLNTSIHSLLSIHPYNLIVPNLSYPTSLYLLLSQSLFLFSLLYFFPFLSYYPSPLYPSPSILLGLFVLTELITLVQSLFFSLHIEKRKINSELVQPSVQLKRIGL